MTTIAWLQTGQRFLRAAHIVMHTSWYKWPHKGNVAQRGVAPSRSLLLPSLLAFLRPDEPP